MDRFSSFIAESNWMYHGTTHDFDKFRVDFGEYMVDRAIGVHFAADPALSDRFAKGLYAKEPNGVNAVWRVRAPKKSRILKVPQARYKLGNKQSDQHAIGAFVIATVFEQDDSLFLSWFTRRFNYDEDMGREVLELLKNGKAPSDKKFGVARSKGSNTLRAYMNNFDANLILMDRAKKADVVKEFNRIMDSRGIDALVYENTSPNETQDQTGFRNVRSKKSYILLAHALDKYSIERV